MAVDQSPENRQPLPQGTQRQLLNDFKFYEENKKK
jgi:hypothetical protein